ncbi:MAG: M28 family metallopeptidase [Solirubrobacteraceae bacterium]
MIAYDVAYHLAHDVGTRTAGSAAERRAQRYVEGRFRRSGLQVHSQRFALPGGGSDRDVIGIWDGEARCLVVVMGHIDTVATAAGGDDNATGTGVVTALAPRLAALRPRCDVWLVATGAEERVFTGSPDHLGALALVRRIRREGRARDLRVALAVDMLGLERRFWLTTPKARPGAAARRVLAAAQTAGVTVEWHRDTGLSDHREFALAGLPGALLGVWGGDEPCHHLACDTWRRIRAPVLGDAQRVVEALLRAS